MKTQKGNPVVIVLIVVVVAAITVGVIGWLLAQKSQAPVQRSITSQSAEPTPQDRSEEQPETSEIQEKLVIYRLESKKTTTEKKNCVEGIIAQKEKFERYLTRDFFSVPGKDTDKTFSDLRATYYPYAFLYRDNTCYGIYVGEFPSDVFNVLVNEDGEVILKVAIVFNMNDLYDLYVENFNDKTLDAIMEKIPSIRSGRNTITSREYKLIMDTLLEGSEFYRY